MPSAWRPAAALLLLACAGAASAQTLPCVGCSFELSVVNWNGTALPATIASGAFRIENTGQSADTYEIAVTVDNQSWTAETAEDVSPELDAGSGLLAGDMNTFDFQVNLLVPEDADAAATTVVTITVTSQSDDALDAESQSATGTALQVYAWGLDCTPAATVRKSDSVDVNVTATNLGNGQDGAIIVPVGFPNGIHATETDPVSAARGASVTRTSTLGAGLALEDGVYTLRWDLRRPPSIAAVADCTTALEVTGGTPATNGPGGDKESPAGGGLALGLAAALLASMRRKAQPA